MTVDMVVNICFCLFIGNIFGILAASNLGYVLAHMFALSGFVLLRRDRPNWPRPIKLAADLDADRRAARGLVPDPDDRRLRLVRRPPAGGYGGTKEKVIGVGVLVDRLAALLLPPDRPGQGADPLA